VERKVGFHDNKEETTSEAWDVRVAIKEMKDEELDYLLRDEQSF